MVGRTLLHYTIARALGSGGMGVVYEAEDAKLGRRVAFLGFSWGGRVGSIAMAVERRFDAGVLASRGFPLMQSLPEVKEINFAPRITIPVLMVNGRHDRVFPLETSQKPMFAFLGSPGEHKKHVVLDAGHGLLEARSQVAAEVLAWFDKYFGAVQ